MQQYCVNYYLLDSLEVEDLGADNPNMEEEEDSMVDKMEVIPTIGDRDTVSDRVF